MPRVSVVIPSRMEPYLARTIEDVLKQSRGDIEVIAILDGYWPTPQPANDPRVKLLHWGEAKGLRPSINAGMAMATGEFLFKLDSHCGLSEGFDVELSKLCEDNEILVPAKYSLDRATWTPFRDPWHYYYLTFPWQTDGTFIGLQDKNYGSDYNRTREHLRTDDILSYQGSAWFLRRTHWDRIGPMDHEHLYMAQEAQELGLRTWTEGGRCQIVKDVWYSHLWKGSNPETKRKFQRLHRPWNDAMLWATRYWMTHPGFPAVIDRFGPLPGWPADWHDEAMRRLA